MMSVHQYHQYTVDHHSVILIIVRIIDSAQPVFTTSFFSDDISKADGQSLATGQYVCSHITGPHVLSLFMVVQTLVYYVHFCLYA